MNTMDTLLMHQSVRVGEALLSAGRVLATAESCTGGWIAKLVTDVPGSSEWFDRGFITYSNAAKCDMLGVSAASLRAQGAVSEPVVREMAEGGLARSRADLCVAVSGIAGPGGGSAEKPVGLVWVAWAGLGRTEARRFVFEGTREKVRRQAVEAALDGVLERLRVQGGG